jgi:cytochrome c oxidase subunit 3
MAVTVTGDSDAVAQRESALGVSSSRKRGGGRGNGRGNGGGGGGPNGPGGPGSGGGGEPRRFSPDRYRLGVLVGLASILMMFTALASAYVVRSGMPTSTDWRGGEMPSFAYLSTALIILSSLTFTRAHAALRHEESAGYRLWLGVTLLLGLGFLSSQILAWRELVGRGLYLASNPHSSFFYVLTGLHALHLAGGIVALALLYAYARRAGGAGENVDVDVKRRTLTEVVGTYWHFMDALWVVLFLLLLFWR